MSPQLKSAFNSMTVVRQLSVLLVVMLVASAALSGGALATDVPKGDITDHDHGHDKGAPAHDDGHNKGDGHHKDGDGHHKGTDGHKKGTPTPGEQIDQRQNNTQRNQALINYGIQVNVNEQGQRAVGNAIGTQYQYNDQTNLAGINYGIQVNANFQRQIAGLNASVDQTQISRQANLAGINYGLQQNINIQEQQAAITQENNQAQNAPSRTQGHDKSASSHNHEHSHKGTPGQQTTVDQTQLSTQLNAAIINYGTQENLNDQTQEGSVTQSSGAIYNLNGGNEIDFGQDMLTLASSLASNGLLDQPAS